ncbi:cryptochrome DASH, chloroplastic/mitochondrial isoform X1 [Pistacia vera]|uniref:cryptochrome DASH, chloroplastic/mitochondrial isoform X1 n=1 Tax=Pistacia vera TaxID=55513 RepID=UPI001262CE8C|nr:cryptochrome DASH, chloroplastic/mitochondrial isoform X1 [Pistacia vera]
MTMAHLRNSLSYLSLKELTSPSKHTLILFPFRSQITSSTSRNSNPDQLCLHKMVHQVPGLDSKETSSIVEQIFDKYTSKNVKRNGKGIAIVWFRNDLRVLDNEALYKAWISSEMVLPVYCVDPRLFNATYNFGFPKTGASRAQFLMECLADLRKNLMNRGLNLLIQHGEPEEIIPSLAKSFGAHTVYAQKETCSEELNVERLVRKGLQQVVLSVQSKDSSRICPKLQLIWGTTLYHLDDIPFSPSTIPDVYTQFRKYFQAVEAKCTVRGCIRVPTSLGPAPSVGDWGCVPSTEQLGLQSQKVSRGMKFMGGESAAVGRVHEYFWKKDLLRVYKETRNGMLGPDYSTKFSPWLASGSLSPRYIYEEVKRYERERHANDSTYWVLFELIWRDYFRFISVKYGNSIFHLGGPRKLEYKWSQDQKLFESWRDGCTGYPLIDANMKELSATGFMSNRGRQIVCSFLVRDMGIDWRMGAEWFETLLLDYDPCSNYGNWTYGAGVGNDPREDRYFSIPKQAQTYDPEGEYVAYWLPELQALPKEKRNFPGKSYIEQVVPLKHGKMNSQTSQNTPLTGRRNNFRVNRR